ncbi:hypothetical protein ACFL5N_02030 [bacterium]
MKKAKIFLIVLIILSQFSISYGREFIGYSQVDENVTSFNYVLKGGWVGLGPGLATGDVGSLALTTLVGMLFGFTLNTIDLKNNEVGLNYLVLRDMEAGMYVGAVVGGAISLLAGEARFFLPIILGIGTGAFFGFYEQDRIRKIYFTIDKYSPDLSISKDGDIMLSYTKRF